MTKVIMNIMFHDGDEGDLSAFFRFVSSAFTLVSHVMISSANLS